jgi:hypothetical protein
MKGWKIFGAFALLGPPASLLSFAVVLPVLMLTGVATGRDDGPDTFGALIGGISRVLPYGLLIFYIMGGLQAAFIGLVSAWWHRRRGHIPLWVPLTAALVAFPVFMALLEGRYWYGRIVLGYGEWRGFWNELEDPLTFLFLHLALAFWPWLLLRFVMRGKEVK